MKVLGIDGGNVPGFCKRRQVARREEVDAGDPQCRAQLRRSPRSVGEEPEQVEGDLVAALLQETRNAFGKRLGESIKLPLPHLLGLLLVDGESLLRGTGELLVLELLQDEVNRLLVHIMDLFPSHGRECVDEAIAADATHVALAGRGETAPFVPVRPLDHLRLYGIAVDVGRNIHQLALLVRHVLAHAEARLPHRSRVDATAIIGHGRVLLERLHEGAHIVHAAEEPLAEPLPAGLVVQPGIHLPFLADLGKSIARIKRGDTVEQFLIAQLRRLGQMDEQVEVVAHEAIRQNLDAGKLRHAPQPLDEARTLLVSQVERAVRDPTDQVITTIRLEIAQSPHARIIAYSATTPPLLHHHWGQSLAHSPLGGSHHWGMRL